MGGNVLINAMRMNPYCEKCLLDKNLGNYPSTASSEEIAMYQQKIRNTISENKLCSAPEIVYKISRVYQEMFGPEKHYTEIKQHFNALMLTREAGLQARVDAADDPLKLAVQYAMTGNFIDFAALKNVDEDKLTHFLDEAGNVPIEDGIFTSFKEEILLARNLVYFTDNCGEIVTDKVLIRTMCKYNPALRVTVIVRGEPVVNDATMEDAVQVGLSDVAQTVIGNGSGMAGNVLSALSQAALREIESADVLIAKGQGNYESLSGCGKNIFYIFMCKCQLFMDRFRVPQFSGILTREPTDLHP